jgi:hypothetical protein
MSEPPPIADAVRPLDYARPARGRSRAATAAIGLTISAAYAFSGGMIAFGMMMRGHEAPAFVAIGVASAILATGAVVTAWVARR